ncbi:hypothetical protein [Ectobacillus polymachus]
MNVKEIKRVLQETYNKEIIEGKQCHIAFWHDKAGEFMEAIDELLAVRRD